MAADWSEFSMAVFRALVLGRNSMVKTLASNMLLAFGTSILAVFGAMQVLGFHAEPLLPAVAAFCIGCTAVLDRIGIGNMN